MLNYDIKFVSTDDSIYLKTGNFNCFKYETKKRADESIYETGKRSFCERRTGQWRAPRPRQIRQLESKLRDKNIVTCEWNDSLITIVFSSGVITYLSVKPKTLDVTQILFDRYFVGKIPSHIITSVALCKSLIFFTHGDKTGTLVTFGRTNNGTHPSRITDREPHLQSIELGGGSRKTDRHVSWSENESRVLILVWSIASIEPAPWSPVIEDCANLHLYQVIGQQMLLIAYHQLESETLTAELSRNHDNTIHIVEQSACSKVYHEMLSFYRCLQPVHSWNPKFYPCSMLFMFTYLHMRTKRKYYSLFLSAKTFIDKLKEDKRAYDLLNLKWQSSPMDICHNKNGINLDWIRYEVGNNDSTIKLSSLHENATRVVLAAPARTTRRSDCDTRLLAGCIDGSLHVIHHIAGLTHSVKAGFIASDVRWSGHLVVCVDEVGRLHCFDRALSLIHDSANCHDLAQYVRDKNRLQILATNNTTCGSMILAIFKGGPLLLIRIMHPRLLTAWIRARRTSNAMALLRAMDWEVEGTDCLWAVNKLVCAALRSGAEAVAEESTAQAALGAFLAPSAPHCPKALRYAPHITDLARKFFHHLLRRGRIEKALSLAVDLGAWDLFVDARCAASRRHLEHLADEAAALAATYATQTHGSECSDSCSRCSSGSYSDSDGDRNDKQTVLETTPPPLPRVTIHHPQIPLVPVPRTRQEPISTTSIRPNLHQYLDKENSIWNKELPEDQRDTRLVDSFKSNRICPKWTNEEEGLSNRRLNSGLASISENSDSTSNEVEKVKKNREEMFSHYRQGYRNDLTDVPNTLYRYWNNVDHRMAFRDRRFENSVLVSDRSGMRTGERNKVKFSDTVTVAVVSDPPQFPEPARELAESLPLCSPHNYLAAFTPLANNHQHRQTHQQPTSNQDQHSQQNTSAGTPLDYVEV